MNPAPPVIRYRTRLSPSGPVPRWRAGAYGVVDGAIRQLPVSTDCGRRARGASRRMPEMSVPVDRRLRLLSFAVFAVALGLLITTQWLYFQRGVGPGDAFNYLAAGERLNDGHQLYALQ